MPNEAEAIRKACHALLNGATLWSIAKEWNAAGAQDIQGLPWEGSKVRQMLLRPSIAGLAVYDGEILDGVTGRVEAHCATATPGKAVRKYLSDPKRFTGSSAGPQTSAEWHRLLRRVRQAHGHHGASRPRAARNALPTSARTWAA